MSSLCHNCKYWEGARRRVNIEDDEGLCRRYPPVIDTPRMNYYTLMGDAPEDASSWTAWAQTITLGDDWCGEWKGTKS